MNSNRMRFLGGVKRFAPAIGRGRLSEAVDLDEIPAPLPIIKPTPEMVVRDILLATLARVQESGSPEIAAAAAQFVSELGKTAASGE